MSLFKMDSVTEMINEAGKQDKDFVLAYPERYVSHDIDKMKKLVFEYNSNRLISCGIAKGYRLIGFLTVEEESEAQKIINSKLDEVDFVAKRLLRCIELGMDIY